MRPKWSQCLFLRQLPVQSVEIRDGDALEKGDDEQRDVAAEIVE